MTFKGTDDLKRLLAYVGSYKKGNDPAGGGIFVFDVSQDGSRLSALSRVPVPEHAGYLAHAPSLGRLYAVDERKTDGRGPVDPPAQVHAFAIAPEDGSLLWLNSRLSLGPNPTYISVDETRRILVTANHGGFEHIERVTRTAVGEWTTDYLYDDSTIVMYNLDADGRVGGIQDVYVLAGHGKDPNDSAQANGHAQASPHAHCAAIHPSGKFLVVCDKGTDQILVFELGARLQVSFRYQFPAETAPRHVAFDPPSGRVFVTCEISSELASFDFHPNGALQLLDKQTTTAIECRGRNEPAEVRVHPNGKFVYVNNRGEDSIAWFAIDAHGKLSRQGHVSVAKSIHPGLAARNFTFAPSGTFLIFADRPANLLRSYSVDMDDGSLKGLTQIAVPDPAFVAFVEP